ncbi:hypothetical protein FQZ97_1073890 [compost metagenome]
MRIANLFQQRFTHGLSSGQLALQRRALLVDTLDLAAVEVGREQRIGLRQSVSDDRAIQVPVPVLLPGQRLGQVAGHRPAAHGIDLRLLLGFEHLQQQAALLTAALKGLQQPELQGMVIRIVMLLANQYARLGSEPFDQLLRRQ